MVKKIVISLFILLLAFVGYIMISTGFFRTIEPKFEGKILERIALYGAEDIMISQIDSFAIISSTNRAGYPRAPEEKDGLFIIDLKSHDFVPMPLTNGFNQPFSPHGISFYKKDSTYQVMAINHSSNGHSIEVFELHGKNLKHVRTLKHPSMVSPNDLVIMNENRFYFTNDHKYTKGIGRLVEDYCGLAISNVVYFDTKDYRDVAGGIGYANGINFDRKRNLLYVASPRHFLVKVYSVQQDGSLSFIENIHCRTGVDNIELDQEGNLWIGCHPNLLRFSAYAKGKKATSPSEIIKIICREKGDYSIEKIYVEDGHEMSASTVAATFGSLIFAGNVMDDEFLILERSMSSISD